MEFKKQYEAQIRRSLATLIKLDDIVSFKSVCEHVSEDLKILV